MMRSRTKSMTFPQIHEALHTLVEPFVQFTRIKGAVSRDTENVTGERYLFTSSANF